MMSFFNPFQHTHTFFQRKFLISNPFEKSYFLMPSNQGRDGGWARVGAAHPSFFLCLVGAPPQEPPKKIKNRNKNNYHNK
jgi:hypothetical protein